MRLQTITYTTDMGAAADWWTRVLGTPPTYASDAWTSFAIGDAVLALHAIDRLPDPGRTIVSLVATEPLEAVAERLAAAGVAINREIRAEAFGRSLVVVDPDGSPVQVNEH